jgi:hypothetical protein
MKRRDEQHEEVGNRTADGARKSFTLNQMARDCIVSLSPFSTFPIFLARSRELSDLDISRRILFSDPPHHDVSSRPSLTRSQSHPPTRPPLSTLSKNALLFRIGGGR